MSEFRPHPNVDVKVSVFYPKRSAIKHAFEEYKQAIVLDAQEGKPSLPPPISNNNLIFGAPHNHEGSISTAKKEL